MSESGTPERVQSGCGNWSALTGKTCSRKAGHDGACRSGTYEWVARMSAPASTSGSDS